MSGIQLQKKIYKGMGKVAKKLGRSFDVFHPVTANNPLQQNNYILTAPVWFEQLKPAGEDIVFVIYADLTPDKWNVIQIGDYFQDTLNGDVYYLYQTQFNQIKPKAIWCTDVISVSRNTGYSNGESISQTIYTDIPVRIVSDNSFGGDHYTPAPGYFTDSLQKVLIYSGAPQGSYKLDDIVTDELGNKFVIKDAVWDSQYIIRAQAYAPTNQN
jgi:hypothetical protein